MKARKEVKDQPEICRRMSELLRTVWHGNAAQMARDLHTSYPAISRALLRQIPSGKILQTLAARPDVDIAWLLSGNDKTQSAWSKANRMLGIFELLADDTTQPVVHTVSGLRFRGRCTYHLGSVIVTAGDRKLILSPDQIAAIEVAQGND